MITVISGTDRPENLTQLFAKYLVEAIEKISDEKVKYVDLQEVMPMLQNSNIYDGSTHSLQFQALQEASIIETDKIVVLAPEYNGSFPGVLKVFIDACTRNRYKENFHFKKVFLSGLAAGRAGNLRGVGQLAAIFNHMSATIIAPHFYASGISKFLDGEMIVDDGMRESLDKYAKRISEA